MRYYPICLDIRCKLCVVIGGGAVAERKVISLLDGGAVVTVISPAVTDDLEKKTNKGKITLIRRQYKNGDLKEALLVFAATGDKEINLKISEEAKREGVLLNVADEPERCDFIVPSVVERGSLSIAVSTGGSSPAFAKKMRIELEKKYGDEYAIFLNIMASIRRKLLTKGSESDRKGKVFNKLASSSIPKMIKAGRWEEVDKTILSLLGEEFSLASLGIKKGR